MNIVLRIDSGGGGSLGLGHDCRINGSSIEDAFHPREAQRPVGNADDADMGVADLAGLVLVVENRRRPPGEVAPAPRPILQAPAAARAPRRRANSSKPQRRPAGQAGRRISTMISSGVSAVVSAPWKKSAAWITCAPDFPTTAISASQVSAIPGISAAGSAWARLPPTVPRLRT